MGVDVAFSPKAGVSLSGTHSGALLAPREKNIESCRCAEEAQASGILGFSLASISTSTTT
jgi:hypothetical protein